MLIALPPVVMTKQYGTLAPTAGSAAAANPMDKSIACIRCDHIRRQAEEAFTELRTQTDLHIAAVQKKLREEHLGEIHRLRAANEALQAELAKMRETAGPRDAALRTELERTKREAESAAKKQTADLEQRISILTGEYDARIEAVKRQVAEAEQTAEREREALIKSHRRESLNSESRIKELQVENGDLVGEVQALKSQLHRAKLEVDKQTHFITAERDDAIHQLSLVRSRLLALENGRQGTDLDKAKQDLAYRRRIGEMESEIRRTEIESVRLRREIIQLNQKIELMESEGRGGSWLTLRSARPKLFALEEGSRNSGRITRIGHTYTSPKTSPRDIEEVPSPTFN